MGQVIYTPKNPPSSGNGKVIWDTLTTNGFEIHDLHYNPGRVSRFGNGTWACEISANGKKIGDFGCWCGVIGKRLVYIQSMVAPYEKKLIGFHSRTCPFMSSIGKSCEFNMMTFEFESPRDLGLCDLNCDTLTDSQLIKLCRRMDTIRKRDW